MASRAAFASESATFIAATNFAWSSAMRFEEDACVSAAAAAERSDSASARSSDAA